MIFMVQDLQDGEVFQMQGSGKSPYQLKNVGGVFSCTCPSWRNQSLPIERRTCKHLRKLRGDAAEEARIGNPLAPVRKPKEGVVVPDLMLADVWDGILDPTGWLISEKLDGVRALWNGKEFITRGGNIYLAPAWFVRGLPTEINLDGELWIGRNQFAKVSGICRRHDQSDAWKEVRYLVFDAPDVKAEYGERMQVATSALYDHPYALVHQNIFCTGTDHLRQELARIEALGGEGLMLRQPKSAYIVGRSNALLKVKSFIDDEAIIVGYKAGKGKHKGKVGAFDVDWKKGIKFSIGTGLSDYDRSNPPAIGTLVKFKYMGLTGDGIPRFASYIGVRED